MTLWVKLETQMNFHLVTNSRQKHQVKCRRWTTIWLTLPRYANLLPNAPTSPCYRNTYSDASIYYLNSRFNNDKSCLRWPNMYSSNADCMNLKMKLLIRDSEKKWLKKKKGKMGHKMQSRRMTSVLPIMCSNNKLINCMIKIYREIY